MEKHHGVLRDFPRSESVSTRYHIDLKGQANKIFHQLSVVSHVRDGDRLLVTSKILLWLAAFISVTALLLRFVKDINDEKPFQVILDFSIAELVIALIAVLLALLKHVFKWRSLRKLKNQFKTWKILVLVKTKLKYHRRRAVLEHRYFQLH